MGISFSWNTTEKPGLAALQALRSREHCLNMSLPPRSWNVPWSEKLNMVEVKLKKIMSSVVLHPPFTAVGGLEEMFPILSSPRLNQFTQGALRLPLWVRLRESKLLSQRKRQRNSNTYPPCQTATLPQNLLPPSSHSFLPRSPSFSTIKENQTLNESKSPKVNTLTLNIISSTDFSKDKMPKVWKSFRNRAFPFLAIPPY